MKKALKVIGIIIGVVLGLFTGLIVIMVINDFKIEDKLDEIVIELSKVDTVDMDIKTSGDYAKVEKAIKSDYNDFYNLVDKTIYEYDNPIIEKCLSAQNYVKDGPYFIETRKELDQLKKNRKELNEEMLAIVSDKNISSKIKKYRLDDYYADLYKEYIYDLEILIKDVIEEDESFNKTIDNVIEILDFLGSNKEHWIIEEDNIVFDDQDILDKYNWLTDKICPSCNEDELPSA